MNSVSEIELQSGLCILEQVYSPEVPRNKYIIFLRRPMVEDNRAFMVQLWQDINVHLCSIDRQAERAIEEKLIPLKEEPIEINIEKSHFIILDTSTGFPYKAVSNKFYNLNEALNELYSLVSV